MVGPSETQHLASQAVVSDLAIAEFMHMAGSHQVALLHGTSTVHFHFIHRNATALVQAGWHH